MVKRFAINSGWDKAKTDATLTDTLAWRNSYGANQLPFLPPPPSMLRGYDLSALQELYDREPLKEDSQEGRVQHQMHRSYSGTFYRWDKEGRPVWLERTGRVDSQGIVTNVQSVTPPGSTYVEQILRAHVVGNELGRLLCLHNTLRFGKEVDQLVIILDLAGLGWHQLYRPALEVIKAISALDQVHYPENMHRVFLINAPSVATAFWRIIQYWLNEQTKSKVIFLGTDYKTRLLEDIDAENLPELLGGTCELEVPLPSDSQCVDLTRGAKEVKVAASGSHDEVLEVTKGEVVSWEFSSEKYDIGFSVLFTQKGAASPVPMLPNQRVESHKLRITGDFTSPEDGTVLLRFDNTYSRMTAKSVVVRLYSLGDEASLEKAGQE
eukprot:NODE_531_length_1638_cov_181.385777_g441_i0.p1 GENE.NODE_531_length_1638_cov_181.385777_g441_i0~~NODE_531_length_1638_cov_181.385777_g441_i0.p1  ORF type:complete len:380 (-),score=95.85 NODE_531_length_1638_cov_181.385777_g441_i0:224-1363(-)